LNERGGREAEIERQRELESEGKKAERE